MPDVNPDPAATTPTSGSAHSTLETPISVGALETMAMSRYANGLRGAAAIATMHGKERVIAPILASLDIDLQVSEGIDTDALGTFTGERTRQGSGRDAAVAKARLALERSPHVAYGIGSEGSFGPDPLMPFVTAGHEIIALQSRDGALLLIGSDLTTSTNCTEAIVNSADEAVAAAVHFGFPTHAAVVVGIDHGRPTVVLGLTKGIASEYRLREEVERVLQRCGSACIQSDMRAHVNPMRMQAIERAAANLVRRATSRCLRCRHPGYNIVARVPGLPCEDCGEPSEMARALTYACSFCDFTEERPRPDGRTTVDPGQCNVCNP